MKILRNIFFVNTKIYTGYRYKDLFSIIPINGLDKLPKHAKYYPCIIEVRYEGPNVDPLCTDIELVMKYSDQKREFYSKKIEQILSLLTVFTIYHFKMPSLNEEWFNDGSENRIINQGFTINDFESETDSFSEISSPSEVWHEKDYLILILERFVLPSNLDQLLDLFFNSQIDFSERFYKSAKLHHIATNLYYESVSLSFTAFISSIETLAQFYYKESKVCEKCSQPQYSATRKFRDFFLEFGEGKYLDREFVEKIYNWRSKMLHTGDLFISELERAFSRGNQHYAKYEEQGLTIFKVASYVKVALVNFLIKKATGVQYQG